LQDRRRRRHGPQVGVREESVKVSRRGTPMAVDGKRRGVFRAVFRP
jgi:hypothetical protein